jgi:4-aminobutyrate aminotransferase-like enzyme
MSTVAAHRRDNLAAALVGAVATAAAMWWWQQRRKSNSDALHACLEQASLSQPCYTAPSMKRESSSEEKQLDKAKVHELRRDHFCGALSVSYANRTPLMLVRGRGSKLYDEQDVEYLDTRNNVAHVGHSHPKVVAAMAIQAAQINTNTRYLHPNIVRLAEKLLARCPKPLSKVFIVNSGSEANDLALRVARVFTGKQDVICVEVRSEKGVS